MNMFEYATRNKLRFETPRQMISVEDLWDLPLTTSKQGGISLDAVARIIAVKLSEHEKMQSFVAPNSNDTAVKELKIALEVVKHVIGVRKEENEAMQSAEQQPEPDVSALVKVLEYLMETYPASRHLQDTCSAALAAHRKGGEK